MSRLTDQDFREFERTKVWKYLKEILTTREREIMGDLVSAEEIPYMKEQQGRLRELKMFILYPELIKEAEKELRVEEKQIAEEKKLKKETDKLGEDNG